MMNIDPFTPGLLTRLPAPPRKVVLLRASRIGDFICATPALRALRKALPQAEITMITLPMLRDLALRSPYLDNFVAFPGFPGIAEQFFRASDTTRFLQAMQAEGYDLAIQMQGTGIYSNPFMLLLGARTTAGFVRPGDTPGLLDAALPYPQHTHEIRCVLALSSFLGAKALDETIEFPLWPQDHQEAEACLKDVEAPLIGLHLAARELTRRWDPERFVEVGKALRRRYGGTILLLGEAEEQAAMESVAGKIGSPCLNLTGHTSLVTLGAIIARLAILITNDTGPAHIAYALNTPTVTIFGAGNPATNGPLQRGPFRVLAHPVPCRPCGYHACPIGYTCLNNITVAQVVEQAEEIIQLSTRRNLSSSA
ncbi:glycosyltransferase family 9 protein [Ktedonosporobacter rubrisoli]|uniref:Glycosyltransferase family 9 protein n=1 Tax=Ktedonosporobacter rubrisoli TaxID=2509675 RepID=A0A4P6JS39_KTERU|nr:glycosyltransferase family 9 protein [Ktedonosporobacter rubrisoli]QBD78328.1 glycosyltransferase family 9 protein [Ktedonosporobacter rubrisoli]